MANVTTPKFRASYPKLFKPEKNDLNGKMEYSVVALFKKGEDLSKLKNACEQVLIDEFGADKSKWPKNLKSPFRDQADKEKDGVMPPGYEAGALFVTLKSIHKPGVVDKNVQPIMDEAEIYAGCFLHATVRPYYYDQKGNKGIALGLQNIQKLEDGDPIGGGRAKAESEFAPVEGSGDLWS